MPMGQVQTTVRAPPVFIPPPTSPFFISYTHVRYSNGTDVHKWKCTYSLIKYSSIGYCRSSKSNNRLSCIMRSETRLSTDGSNASVASFCSML